MGTSVNSAAIWSHARLQSAGPNPANISVDFETQGKANPGADWGQIFASPAWLNVQRPDLGPGDKVRAVWMNQPFGLAGTQSQVDLTYAGNGRFTAQLPDTLLCATSVDGYESPDSHQRLALVVNGDWLKDSVSGQSNFNLDLSVPSGWSSNDIYSGY